MSYNVLKLDTKRVLKPEEVEEQSLQVWKRCLEKPSAWNSSWITVWEKKTEMSIWTHSNKFKTDRSTSINCTWTVTWWLYVAPVSLSLQMTTTPATGRPWASVWQWTA